MIFFYSNKFYYDLEGDSYNNTKNIILKLIKQKQENKY